MHPKLTASLIEEDKQRQLAALKGSIFGIMGGGDEKQAQDAAAQQQQQAQQQQK